MGFIDCDSHVVENDDTWSYLSEAEVQYRPSRVRIPRGSPGAVAGAPAPPLDIWLVGDTWNTAVPKDGDMRGNANVYQESTTDVTDIQARLEDLDSLGIDVQLLLSSFWIGIELDNAAAEFALSRSYNRWLADRLVGESATRLPWAIRPPLRSIPAAINELTFGKEHGAIGMQVRGIEHGMFLSDPYFFPLYEHANDLEMVVVVHVGEALRRIDNQMLGRVIPSPASMCRQLYPLLAGFHAVIAADFDTRFPNLRWLFVEGGSTWAPGIIQMDARLRASGGDFLHLRPITPAQLDEKNVFISCEADEDLAYLSKVLGDNVLVAGTDYGHNDLGSELGAHTTISARHDVDSELARKIVDTNGRRLLCIPESFRPAQTTGIGPIPHIRGCNTPDGAPILFPTR
jgi:5-carboxyvanillate decarboxylase